MSEIPSSIYEEEFRLGNELKFEQELRWFNDVEHFRGIGSIEDSKFETKLEELKHLPRDSGLDIVGRDSHEMNAVISAEMCQRRLKIQPKGGAKDCHLGWWSALGVRLGVGGC